LYVYPFHLYPSHSSSPQKKGFVGAEDGTGEDKQDRVFAALQNKGRGWHDGEHTARRGWMASFSLGMRTSWVYSAPGAHLRRGCQSMSQRCRQ